MSDVPSPKATRQSRPRWLDPKLILGIVLVLASMALGAKVIGDANTTSSVWVAKQDIRTGMPVTQDDLQVASVRFTSSDDANAYLSASDQIPAGSLTLRDIAAGEFVPRKAITTEKPKSLVTLGFPVPGDTLPTGVQAGDRVDVWFRPKDSSGGDGGNQGAVFALQNALLVGMPSDGVSSDQMATVSVQVDVGKALDGGGKPFDIAAFVKNLSSMQVYIVQHKDESQK